MANAWEKIKDAASGYASDKLDEKGLQIFLKTDFGPAVKVYDADQPGGNDSSLPIKYAVTVTDRNGKRLTGYGEPPATNPLKAALLIGVVGAGIYFLLAGVVSSINQVIK